VSAVAHSPQKRAAAEFSKPHCGQRLLNGVAHCSQNFNPAGFSAPQLEQVISRIQAFYEARLRQFDLKRHGIMAQMPTGLQVR
jgi:hypothetical protein